MIKPYLTIIYIAILVYSSGCHKESDAGISIMNTLPGIEAKSDGDNKKYDSVISAEKAAPERYNAFLIFLSSYYNTFEKTVFY